jgi:putative inorganic carbon (hco3(-)) transporter
VRRLVPLLHAALLLAFLPALPHPFLWPKLALLCAGAVAALLLPRTQAVKPGISRAVPLVWLVLLSASALVHPTMLEPLLLDGAAALLLYALLTRAWPVKSTLKAIAWLGCVEAAVVLLQAPFAARRLEMFGTLGNPDFAAGWLGVSLCLALGETGMLLPALLQLAALAVIGSFASILALAAACLVALPRRKLALFALAPLAIATSGRNLQSRIDGRLDLDKTAIRHLLDAPLLGGGPVTALFANQDHIHNDLLERALTQGWPCALLLAALAAYAIRKGRKGSELAAAAALASLCARSLVDFPLARPAELALFVTLVAACLTEPPCTEPSPPLPPHSSPQPPLPPIATG